MTKIVNWFTITDCPQRSYQEWKDILPKSKAAERYRQDAHDKDMQITDFKHQLATAKASQTNGVGTAGGDSAYWKGKYENLLASI